MSENEISLEELMKYLEIFLGKSKEEAIAKAVENLSSEDKIMLFSDLEPYEIPRVAVYYVIAKRYELNWLKDYCDNELKLKVSTKRMGRKEIVNISASKAIEETKKRTFFRREKEEKTEAPID